MGDAIFSLVREDTLATTESLNYDADNEQGKSHDEVLLVDDLGSPAAFPVQQGMTSLDASHEYSDGSQGTTPISLRHQIVLAVDWIDNATRRRLHEWMQERARVLFTPGFGRHTELAWRPLESTGTTIGDLTGKYTLNISADASRDLVWDDLTGADVMRSGFGDRQRIVSTPGGAGQVFERANENISDPAYPTGTSAGASGWTAGGAGAGTLTITYDADYFGHDDCPGAIRVIGTATTDERYLTYTLPASGSGGPTGEGTINAGLAIMGRLPTDAYLQINNNGTHPTHVDLDGDYSNWTRVDSQYDSTSFVDGSVSFQIVMLGGADNQTCDFWLGWRVITWQANASRYSQINPQWQTAGAARTRDYLYTTTGMMMPQTGTIMASFYVPDWYEPQPSQFNPICAYSGAQAGRFYLVASDADTDLRGVFYRTASASITGDVTLVGGAVNTIAVSWSHDETMLYLNGALLTAQTLAAQYEKTFTDGTYAIGSDSGAMGAWPLVMNTVRVERDVWGSARVANEHETLTNDTASEVVVAARGRTYMIRSIPSQPTVVAGATYWSGPLVIEQVDYTSTLADLTSKEM